MALTSRQRDDIRRVENFTQRLNHWNPLVHPLEQRQVTVRGRTFDRDLVQNRLRVAISERRQRLHVPTARCRSNGVSDRSHSGQKEAAVDSQETPHKEHEAPLHCAQQSPLG
ncbi:uncharacterized protein KRP23_7918 [Phytophthora ramorum]|uniref:uncharacterized protein n=1 Tax=Phytophthora ramorum TaxID=164328 RepID=UPI0030A49961|nr:hypothetical protein KRP23_7918 [Phytophthora ramorum]